MSVAAPLERTLREIMAERILIKDGAMGTMIQREGLSEEDFRADRFADHECELQGNNDLLVLTQPDLIRDIHERFLAAGADVLGTTTFNGNAISQADYGTQAHVRELNREAARLARQAADAWTARTPDKPRFVGGAIGPATSARPCARRSSWGGWPQPGSSSRPARWSSTTLRPAATRLRWRAQPPSSTS